MTIDLDLRPLAPETTLHLPGDPGYDAARVAWNVAVDQRPAAVAVPRTAAEVGAGGPRRRRGRACGSPRRAPATTPARSPPRASTTSSLVRTVRDEHRRSPTRPRGIVRVEGGALWEPRRRRGRRPRQAVLHGSSPDVGIAGYSLGGGIGWYARKLGLATNSITAVELVTARRLAGPRRRRPPTPSCSGRSAAAAATSAWSPRWSSGCTRSRRRTPASCCGTSRTPRRCCASWAAWAPGAPDEVTTVVPGDADARRCPSCRTSCAAASSRSSTAPCSAPTSAAASCSAGLRALRPEMDTFGRVPAASLVRLHMDPEGGAPVVSDSAMLGCFPDAAVDAFLGRGRARRAAPRC